MRAQASDDAAERDQREREHEREAALTCPVTFQPSRAILMRSAACLGKEAGLVDAAEALVRQALAEPGVPTEIAEELRAVLVRPR
mgnify:CR=1 FL=1